jgi:XRE family transcriptional regulator, aerobic/anaerobic benzoate catabolism transcriptional regulator
MGRAESPAKLAENAFLHALGERVRDARVRRGMTRKILARDSGISERYLAQLEAGQGNTSILLLQRVAAALSLPLAELAREGGERAVERALIDSFLDRLPAAKLAEVRAQLLRAHGSAVADRRKRVALVGLRGAGKSTLGRRFAKEHGVPFVELDREVEVEAGTSLKEIFQLHGQQGFRRYERHALERTLETHDACVIATGGSLVSEPGTYDLLLATCFTVWLKAAPEEHMARVAAQGDYRPMAGNREAMEDLRRILAGRARLYARADAVVDTSGRTIDEAFEALKVALA